MLVMHKALINKGLNDSSFHVKEAPIRVEDNTGRDKSKL